MKRFRSIRMQVLLLCLANFIILQGLLFWNYQQARKDKIRTNSEHFIEMIAQVNESVISNCEYLNGMVGKIAYNNMVQAYLETRSESARLENREEIYGLITAFAGLKDGIRDIAVVTEDGDMINLYGSKEDIFPIVEKIPEKTLYYYTGLNEFRYPPKSYTRNYISVGASVYSMTRFDNKEKLGTVLISVQPQCIFSLIGNRTENMPEVIIWDRNHNLIYASLEGDISGLGQEAFRQRNGEMYPVRIEGKEYYCQYGTLDMLDGEIVFLVSQDEMMRGVAYLQRIQIAAGVVTALLMLLFIGVMVKNIINPMNKFMKYMENSEGRELKILKQPVMLKGAAEIEIMVEKFNTLMQEINELTHRLVETSGRLYEIKIEKQQAELEYMYSQINPHFLFNTLETIKGCAVDEEAVRTYRMLSSLGKVFRYCVRSRNQVTLEEELSVSGSYMQLQKTRFGDRLEFIARIPDETRNAYIPKLILQPLLENAVVHGMEEKGAVEICLSAEIAEGVLCFAVKDNGRGVTEEERKKIQKNLKNQKGTAHIGLSNVHNRLRYMYGERYGLEIGEQTEGFLVIIRMPYNLKDELEDGDEQEVSHIAGG